MGNGLVVLERTTNQAYQVLLENILHVGYVLQMLCWTSWGQKHCLKVLGYIVLSSVKKISLNPPQINIKFNVRVCRYGRRTEEGFTLHCEMKTKICQQFSDYKNQSYKILKKRPRIKKIRIKILENTGIPLEILFPKRSLKNTDNTDVNNLPNAAMFAI